MLDTGAYLSALTADSQAFADAAAPHLERPVTTCPGWSVADLVAHMGGVYSWATMVAHAGGDRPTAARARPPTDRQQLMPWFQDWRDRVIDALSSKEPDEPAWMFPPPHAADIAWWRRRQALETSIHLYDVEQAAGTPRPVPPDLASDGVDEALTQFLTNYLRTHELSGFEGTLHLHCTDTEGEWLLDFGGAELEVRREHTKADTAVRGRASDLFLWVWNRIPLDGPGLEVFGRRETAAALGQVRL
jgi:uncharacterized protein (TIGR03083 family)